MKINSTPQRIFLNGHELIRKYNDLDLSSDSLNGLTFNIHDYLNAISEEYIKSIHFAIYDNSEAFAYRVDGVYVSETQFELMKSWLLGGMTGRQMWKAYNEL